MKRKILFLGADSSTMEAIIYAKSKGFHTIVTDYNTPDKKAEKRIADDYWMIDLKDLDSIESRCRVEGISYVYAGTQEFCLDQCRKLSKRLGLEFYAADCAWKATGDKAFYKQICKENGLVVPHQYPLDHRFRKEDVESISFPVIVKPADSCAQQGVSVARDPNELKTAYEKALLFSTSGNIIVEDYVSGIDVFLFCHIHKGRIIILGVAESFPTFFKGRNHFGFYSFYGAYGKSVRDNALSKLQHLVEQLGCMEGACTFQGVFYEKQFYNLEFGYRLDGVRMWRHFEKTRGLNQIGLMVDLATGIEQPELFWNSLSDHRYEGIDAGYVLWCRPGRIDKITGRNDLYERDDLIFLIDNFDEGDFAPSDDNMRSIACIIHFYGETHEELDRKIREVNRTLHFYDQDGNDMLIYLEDYLKLWNERYKE